LLDLSPVDRRRVELPVEVLQRVIVAESGLADAPRDAVLTTLVGRAAQDTFQEFQIRRLRLFTG